MLLSPQCLENVIAYCHSERDCEGEKHAEDTTSVTDTQANFIGLLIYMQAHTNRL